jgi:hypothetical protein
MRLAQNRGERHLQELVPVIVADVHAPVAPVFRACGCDHGLDDLECARARRKYPRSRSRAGPKGLPACPRSGNTEQPFAPPEI